MRKNKVRLFILFFASFCVCYFINTLNVNEIRKENPKNLTLNTKSLVEGHTVYSIDNEGYSNPINNYFKYNEYALYHDNPLTKVRRTPGYPIFLGIHFYLLGNQYAYKILPITQSLLYALSVISIWLIVFLFLGNFVTAWTAAILYGICPFTIGYTFFTITEAIYPAFAILAVAFFAFYYKTKKLYLLYLSGLLLACAFLIRPTNVLLGLSLGLVLMLYLLNSNAFFSRYFFKASIVFVLGVLTLEGIWVFRNYKVTNGEIVPLEKFYHESTMGMGRSQAYLSKWMMCFSNPHPEEMVHHMIESNKLPDSLRYQYIQNYVQQLPEYAFAGYERSEVIEVLATMQNCYRQKENNWGNAIKTLGPNDKEPTCEFDVKSKFELLIAKYKSNRPFRYYFISPYITRGKEFVFQSFTSMYGSLNPESGKFSTIQKVIKLFCYSFNLMLFAATISLMFCRKNKLFKLITVGFPLLLFIAIVNIVHIETRYLLAAYPFMVINLAMLISYLYLKLQSKKQLGFERVIKFDQTIK